MYVQNIYYNYNIVAASKTLNNYLYNPKAPYSVYDTCLEKKC